MTVKKNILLTGAPSSGKTTVIKKVLAVLPSPANGFYTEEERIAGKRIGFMLHDLEGRTGWLAHEEIAAQFRIRRYGVSLENIETIAVPSIAPRAGHIIILDEIGKMECFSPLFIAAAQAALDSPNTVIGTITLGGSGFIQEAKAREDVEIIEVTKDNRDRLPAILLERIALLK